MQNHRSRSLILLPLLLPLPAAALTPHGAPLVISELPSCSSNLDLVEVTATPKGAFEVVWADEGDDFEVKGQRFTRDLLPTGSPRTLLPTHGGLFFSNFLGTWAGRYEVAMNALDFGNDPGDPAAGYRVSLDLEGAPLAPAVRFKPPHFFRLAPAAGGDSLQFRVEPPIFGPPACQSEGLLARRVDAGGAALGPESRITRRASAFSLGNSQFLTDRLPDDTFVAVYLTCEKFNGLVARRLNAAGAPVGNPLNLPQPAGLGNFAGGSLVLAARGDGDFVVGGMVFKAGGGFNGSYTRGVVNGQVFGPTLIPTPPGATGSPSLVDLAASPAGGYLLLLQSRAGNPSRDTLFAQALDAKGAPRGAAVAVAASGQAGGSSSFSIAADAASLPNGRWIVFTWQKTADPTACSERLVGTVLAGE
ncbi:MAG: hypothetical protein ABIS20_11530 [Thermoanaerobaculia bacterium]